MNCDIIKLQKEMSKQLPGKRYVHTLGVSYTAACLAMRYGADITKVEIAGLFHDYAKCMSDPEVLDACGKHELAVTELEARNPYLLHGKLGAYYAEHKYGITEPDILNAITYHTTGRPDMTLVEEIVFLADYIEPNRKLVPGLKQVRELAFVNLEQAILLTLENTITYLEGLKSKEIDPLTIRTYEHYRDGRKCSNG